MGTDDLGVLTDKVPIGKWVAIAIEYIKDNYFHELRAFSDAIGWLLDAFAYFLGLIPPLLFIALVAGLAYWLHRRIVLTVGVVIGLLLILNIGYWDEMLSTVVLVSASTIVCILVGVPIGIAAAHRPWLFRLLRPILDLMQTIPALRLSDPDADLLRPRPRAGYHLHRDLRHPGADPSHPSRYFQRAPSRCSRRAAPSAPTTCNSCSRSSFRTRCRPSCRGSPSASCCRSRWW